MNKKERRITYALAFFIPALICLIGLILGNFAPFGSKDILTAGGMEKYVPYYNELYDRVHSGTFMSYSLSSGMGYDFTTIFTYYLSDPINLIILLFPKASMLSVLNILYMLKLGLAGMFFAMFLCNRREREIKLSEANALANKDYFDNLKNKKNSKKKSDKKDIKLGGSEEPAGRLAGILTSPVFSIIAFSVCYALSGYMLGLGLDTTHLTSVCLFPLIIMGIDKLIDEGSWKLYTVMLSLSFFGSFYMTLVISIFVFIYFALQNYKSGRHFLKSLALKLLADIIALGTSSIIIVNSLNSNVINKNLSIKYPYTGFTTSIFDVIKMQATKAKPSVIYSAASGIDIYAGAAALFLVFAYILCRNIKTSTKLKNIGILVVLIAGMFWISPNYLLNAFLISDTKNVVMFGFIFIFMILSICYSAFINIDKLTSKQLITATIIPTLLIIASIIWSNSYESMVPFLTTLEFIFAYFILVILWKNDSMTKWLMNICFSLLLIVEISISFTGNFKLLGKEAANYNHTTTAKYESVINTLQKQEPMAKVLIHEYHETDHTTVSDTLNGYKYIICTNECSDLPNEYNKITSYLNIDVYENPYAIDGGFYVYKDIDNWSYNTTYPITSTNLLFSDVLKLDEPFTKSTGDFGYQEAFVINPENPEEYLEGAYVFNFTPDLSGDFYGYVMGTKHYGTTKAGEALSTRYIFSKRDRINGEIPFEYAVFDINAFENNLNQMSIAYNNATVSGMYSLNTTAPSDGYILVNAKYSPSWKCTVNNVSVSTKPVSDNFIGIPVSKGENKIELAYSSSKFILGWFITLLFITVLVLLSIKKTYSARNKFYNRITKNGLLNTVSNFITDNYVYFLTMLISGGIFFLMIMFKSCIPFGNDTAVVSDGYAQLLPYYDNIYTSLKAGTLSSLNYDVGIVTNNYTSNIGTLLVPFNDIYMLFPNGMKDTAFIAIFLTYFTLIGASLIYYLTHRPCQKRMDKHNPKLIVFGVAYSLSGFATSYFCFAGFSLMALMFPIVILTMEHLIYNKKVVPYIIVMTFMMITTNYYCFLMCEIMFLYFFVLEHKSFKDFFMNGVRFGLSSILCACLSAFSLLPFYAQTRMSPYANKDSLLPAFSLSNSIRSNISSLMAWTEGNVVTNDNTAANIYCGIFVLLLVAMYLGIKDIKLSVRIRKFAMIGFLFFAYGNELLNFILHGFHFQSMVPNRFAIFWIFMMVTMAYDTVVYFEKINKKYIAILTSICAAFLIVEWTLGQAFPEITVNYIISIIFIIAYLALTVAYLIKSDYKKYLTRAFSVLMLELIISGMYSLSCVMGLNVGFSLNNVDKIDTLLETHESEDDLGISEFIGSQYLNLGYMSNMHNLTIFTSTFTKYQASLLYRWGILSSTNNVGYAMGNPVGDMMLHVKYHFTDQYNNGSVSPYESIDNVDSVNMHENPYYLSLGVFFDKDIASLALADPDDFNNTIEYHNNFSHALGFGDLYTKIEFVTDKDKINENYSYCYTNPDNLDEDGMGTLPVKLYFAKDVEGKLFMPIYHSLTYLGDAELGEQTEIEVDYPVNEINKNYEIEAYILDTNMLAEIHEYLAQYQMTDITYGHNKISGNIISPRDGFIYMSLPDYPSWDIYLDGTKVTSNNYFAGIGIDVTEGSHRIELKYNIPLLKEGWLISGFFIISTIVYIVIINIRKNKKK